MNAFACLRFRFCFTAPDGLRFPPGKAGNVVRGAFGLALRDTAPPADYHHLFEPQAVPGQGPSGLANHPRPFVFRLDPHTARPGGRWNLTLHLFDPAAGLLERFQDAFAVWQPTGVKLHLHAVEQLPSVHIDLDSPEPASRIDVHFLTPTELKSAGDAAAPPEFAVLFTRLRDRIANLTALYGSGPLSVDFRGLGDRAAGIESTIHHLVWDDVRRTSSRTGQTHPIGGFRARAEYRGALSEFLPWLRAGEYTGVGRQTAWGKGQFQVELLDR